MDEEQSFGSPESLESALAATGEQKYVLRLYVAGMTPKSRMALANIRKICEEKLKGRYDLEVIDVYQQPDVAKGEQILAAPTLVKRLPEPLRKIIGDLSDTQRVIVGLNLKVKETPRPSE